ncbi:MAG: hypothetical protein ABJA98_12645 [Acidobacteriota bacterium]
MRKSVCTFVCQLRGPHLSTWAWRSSRSSNLRYDQPSRTWKFNPQTKDVAGVRLPVGTYEVQINAVAPGVTVTSAFQVGVR